MGVQDDNKDAVRGHYMVYFFPFSLFCPECDLAICDLFYLPNLSGNSDLVSVLAITRFCEYLDNEAFEDKMNIHTAKDIIQFQLAVHTIVCRTVLNSIDD